MGYILASDMQFGFALINEDNISQIFSDSVRNAEVEVKMNNGDRYKIPLPTANKITGEVNG